MLRLLILSLLLAACAKKQPRSAPCANPDPTTGSCPSSENNIVDPSSVDLQIQQAASERKRLLDERKQLQKERASGSATPARTAKIDEELGVVDSLLAGIADKLLNKAGSAAPAPEVDTSKAPIVTLNLRKRADTTEAIIPRFVFSHVEKVTIREIKYGNEGTTPTISDEARFNDKGRKLSEIKIPIEINFDFGSGGHCVRTDISSNFEKKAERIMEDC